jgi:hypothetical protein
LIVAALWLDAELCRTTLNSLLMNVSPAVARQWAEALAAYRETRRE